MFFKIDALKTLKYSQEYSQKYSPVLESLFNNAADLKACNLKTCNFIDNSLQHRRFLVNIEKFLITSFLQNTSDGSFCIVLQKK